VRLLVVEDSPLVRKMYGLAFPKREHQLTAAENGRMALTAIAEALEPYDLILLDLCMPDMDGVEFIQAVRANSALAQIPIVLTTAEAEGSELMSQARSLGVAAVVRKPWKPQELRDVVRTILHKPVG
jgi:two-component system, chemotaxis family, chemotaxis protein CheY